MTEIHASFPKGFLWGSATASYQIEGAFDEDGRLPSIWDTFSRTPGKVLNGDTGDVADDHYHRVDEDIALMKSLGLQAYRLSIAWPRVQPTGSGAVNQKGLDFYSTLVDKLLAAGITPAVTLYHWDLPQTLEDAGGWLNRDTAERYADYAEIVYSALADRVGHWITLNEPWCSAYLGYSTGRHAPGKQVGADVLRAVHHLNLGHGLAIAKMRSIKADNTLSITCNLSQINPIADTPENLDAVRRMDGYANRVWLDPIFKGEYPEDVLAHSAPYFDWSSVVRDGDLATINQKLDAFGINYYMRDVIRHNPELPADHPAIYPGCGDVESVSRDLPRTAIGWEIDAAGLRDLLERVTKDYGPIPIYVTENGMACHDYVGTDGKCHDPERIDYLARHFAMAKEAMDHGVDLRGYFVWSFMDNFEWAEGYSKRFGLVYVDYPTGTRYPKDSAAWYSQVIANNGF